MKRAQVIRVLSAGFYLAASFAALAGVSGCNRRATAVPALAPPHVVVAVVRRQTVPLSQDFVAATAALQTVDVKARVQGTLDSVDFKEGTVVHKGQLLFTLQRDKYESSLQAALASLQKSNADLTKARDSQPVVQAQADVDAKRADLLRANLSVSRLTPLAAAKAVPQKDLDNALAGQATAKAALMGSLAQLTNAKVGQSVSIDQAQAAILSSQSQVSDAKLNLSYTTILAPVTGLIGFLQVDQGNVVGSAGDQVLDTISTIDPIKVTFAADEVTYLNLVNTKRDTGVRTLARQPLHLVLADNSVYPYPGRLYTVSRTFDAKTGTISVEALFPNPTGVLRPAQFARIRVTTQLQPNALLIPQLAVVQTQGSSIAYVVAADNTVQLRSLSLGPTYQSDYIVTDGLKAGERVVTQGTQKVRPGMKVVVGPPNGGG